MREELRLRKEQDEVRLRWREPIERSEQEAQAGRLAARGESHFTDGHLRLHAPEGDAEIAGLARPLYGQAIMAAASQLRSRPAWLLREPPIQARP